MISVKRAKNIISQQIFQLDPEIISLSELGDRIIHQDVVATFPSPRFDNSAMDGFAVRSIDTLGASKENPIILKNIGSSSAGSPSKIDLSPGECIKCLTGAKIPKGADAVIMVEYTSGYSDNGTVGVMAEILPGKNIRIEGEEIKKRDILIKKGTRITAI